MLLLGVILFIIGFFFQARLGFIPALLIMGAGVFLALTDIVKTIKKIIKKSEKAIPKYNFNCLYISGLPFESGKCNLKIFKDTADFSIEGKSASLNLNKITGISLENDVFNITYMNDNETVVISLKVEDNYDKINEIKNYLIKNIKINL